ncbi:hypothetical protein DSUL_40065 [Desulfovibrionales bacterium]
MAGYNYLTNHPAKSPYYLTTLNLMSLIYLQFIPNPILYITDPVL